LNMTSCFTQMKEDRFVLVQKTSLRERYKQADLEAIALKYVHRKALCYLITLDENEANRTKEKIKRGDIIGLDKVIVATSNEFDDLIGELKGYEFLEPPTVKIIESNQIVTKEKLEENQIGLVSCFLRF
jgi:hypothetical protein